MNKIALKADMPAAETSGMPDLPLVLFPLRADGTPHGCGGDVASAWGKIISQNAVVFHDSTRKIALFWETPKALMGLLQSEMRKGGHRGVQPFGCISSGQVKGLPEIPSTHPFCIAVRTEDALHRVDGVAGVVSFKGTCLRLLGDGMRAPELQKRIRSWMMSEMSIIEYRRAERDIASL